MREIRHLDLYYKTTVKIFVKQLKIWTEPDNNIPNYMKPNRRMHDGGGRRRRILKRNKTKKITNQTYDYKQPHVS